jgi:spermidine synthase
VLFNTDGRGNVIACAVKYRTPVITDPAKWPDPATLQEAAFAGRLNLAAIKGEHIPIPVEAVRKARVLTDDFAPVEFLNTLKLNNSGLK